MAAKIFLSECDIFQELNDTQIEKLTAIAKEKSVPEGTLLYKEGDPSTHLYLVRQGKVILEMLSDMGPTQPPMKIVIDIVVHREAFGWSTFEPHLHALSAFIAEPTKLILFEESKIRALMEEDCEMGFGIMKGLAKVLDTRLNHARVLLVGERALATLVDTKEA